jgi:hypothetical protein
MISSPSVSSMHVHLGHRSHRPAVCRQQPLVDKGQQVEKFLQTNQRTMQELESRISQLKEELSLLQKRKVYSDIQLSQLQEQYQSSTEDLARRVCSHFECRCCACTSHNECCMHPWSAEGPTNTSAIVLNMMLCGAGCESSCRYSPGPRGGIKHCRTESRRSANPVSSYC